MSYFKMYCTLYTSKLFQLFPKNLKVIFGGQNWLIPYIVLLGTFAPSFFSSNCISAQMPLLKIKISGIKSWAFTKYDFCSQVWIYDLPKKSEKKLRIDLKNKFRIWWKHDCYSVYIMSYLSYALLKTLL